MLSGMKCSFFMVTPCCWFMDLSLCPNLALFSRELGRTLTSGNRFQVDDTHAVNLHSSECWVGNCPAEPPCYTSLSLGKLRLERELEQDAPLSFRRNLSASYVGIVSPFR